LREDSSDTSRSPFKSIRRHSFRIVGVDDGALPARRETGGWAIIVAVLLQGSVISTVRVGRIEVDGNDANSTLRSLMKYMAYDVAMLSGISFGGFNLIDIKQLSRETGKPVIAVIGESPNNVAVRKALRKHFDDWEQRWRMVKNAGPLHPFKPVPNEPTLYFEVKGSSPAYARRVIASSSIISRLPEPVRVASLLAKNLRSLPAMT
jgi:endonuclease V-like protein UPF0215 family